MKLTRAGHIRLALALLLGSLMLFAMMPVDLWVQDYFYNPAAGQWLWDRAEPVSHLVLYDGIKLLIALFGLTLLAGLVVMRNSEKLRGYRRGSCIVVASLILIPLCIGGLKATTNVACPRDLLIYGGDVPYVPIFSRYPAGQQPDAQQRCFPAGHASGGFALLSLAFLFRSARNQRKALGVAVLTGSAMGTYKMAIGDHFLSHTIITLLLAWLIVALIAAGADWLASRRSRPAPTCIGRDGLFH